MTYIFLVSLLLTLCYAYKRKDYTCLACLALIYPAVISIVLQLAGIDNKIFRTSVLLFLYIVMLILKIPYNIKNVSLYYRHPFTINLFLFLFVVVITDNFISPYLAFHYNEIISTELMIVTNIVLPYLLLPFVIRDEYDIESFLTYIVVWGFVLFCGFVAVYGFSMQLLIDRVFFEEMTDGALNSITLSRYAAIAVLALLFMMFKGEFKDKNKIVKLILVFLLIFFCVTLFVSGQRGCIIGVALALLLLAIREEYRKYVFYLIPLFVIVIVISVFLELEVMERFNELRDIKKFERFYDFIRVWHVFSDNDFLWGLGTNGYHYITGFRPYPHNIILQHISDYGLPGLLCVSIVFFYGIMLSCHIVKHDNLPSFHFYACAWVASMFSALVSSGISAHREPYLLTGMLLLIYINYQRDEQRS